MRHFITDVRKEKNALAAMTIRVERTSVRAKALAIRAEKARKFAEDVRAAEALIEGHAADAP